jgi:hypothetical protein
MAKRAYLCSVFNKNVVNMTDQTPIPEPKELSMAEIKAAYPNEWVLIGNPVRDENGLQIISGILIDHSRDKRELAYRWRGNLAAYDKHTLYFVRPTDYVTPRFTPLMLRPWHAIFQKRKILH